MTVEKLLNIFQINNIPGDTNLESDSGWECGPTEMNGIYYNKAENLIIFTQGYEENYCEPEWSLLWKDVTKRNINNPIYCDAGVKLFPFSEYDPYERLYKEELKRSQEFEQYYGVKETEDRYDMIQINQPLFWGIYVRDKEKDINAFIGYIGLPTGTDDFDIEIYIFKEYRRKGYGKIALQTLVEYAKEGRLKVYDKITQEIKSYIPKQIQATVRAENEAGRALMESCGFKLPDGLVATMLVFDEDSLGDSQCIICVKYIYN